MKKIVALLFCSFCFLSVIADDKGNVFQVKVSVTAEKNTFSLKKELVNKGKRAAVRKYILQLNSQTPEKLMEEACNEYENYVESVDEISKKWEALDKNHGQLVGEFQVTLKIESINQWLKTKGFKQQAGIELVIMEEPPAQGQMKLDKAFGNDIDGMKFFMQNYTTFQRRVRDAIIKKMTSFGFEVKLLEDNSQFAKYKNKDGNLVGVYFDVNKNSFAVDRELLDDVRDNMPDAIVLYYRIDTLLYERSTRRVRAAVAFNMKHMVGATTDSVGTGEFEFVSRSNTKDGVINDCAYCVQAAMNSLMNSEGAGAKLNKIAMSIKNSANMPKGPVTLVVNSASFDKKIRLRALIMMKKELIKKNLTDSNHCRIVGKTLTAIITDRNVAAGEQLIEKLLEVFEATGLEVTDDKIKVEPSKVTVAP